MSTSEYKYGEKTDVRFVIAKSDLTQDNPYYHSERVWQSSPYATMPGSPQYCDSVELAKKFPSRDDAERMISSLAEVEQNIKFQILRVVTTTTVYITEPEQETEQKTSEPEKDLYLVVREDGRYHAIPARTLWDSNHRGDPDVFSLSMIDCIVDGNLNYATIKEIYDRFSEELGRDDPFELVEETQDHVVIRWTDEDWYAEFVVLSRDEIAQHTRRAQAVNLFEKFINK